MTHDDRAGLDGLVERIRASRRTSFLWTCAAVAIGLAAIGFVTYRSFGLVQTAQQTAEIQAVERLAPVAQSLGLQVDQGNLPSPFEFTNAIASQAEKLRQENQQASSLVASADKARLAAETESGKVRAQVKSLGTELLAAETGRKKAVADFNEADAQRAAARSEAKQYLEQRDQAVSAKRAADGELVALKLAFKTQKEQSDKTQKKLEEKDAVMRDMRREIAQKEAELRTLRDKTPSNGELRECNSKLEAERRRCDGLNDLAGQAASFEEKYNRCSEELKAAQLDPGKSCDGVSNDNCAAQLASSNEELNGCRNGSRDRDAEIERLRSSCDNSSLKDELQGCQSDLGNVRNDLEVCRGDLANSRDEAKTLSSANDKLKQEHDLARGEAAGFEAKLVDCESNQRRCEDTQSIYEADLRKLGDDLKNCQTAQQPQ